MIVRKQSVDSVVVLVGVTVATAVGVNEELTVGVVVGVHVAAALYPVHVTMGVGDRGV